MIDGPLMDEIQEAAAQGKDTLASSLCVMPRWRVVDRSTGAVLADDLPDFITAKDVMRKLLKGDE